jgi:hypothetical protein
VESAILRVTHIYRREDGRWRLVHRHADKTLRSDTSLPQQGSLCRLRSRGPRARPDRPRVLSILSRERQRSTPMNTNKGATTTTTASGELVIHKITSASTRGLRQNPVS